MISPDQRNEEDTFESASFRRIDTPTDAPHAVLKLKNDLDTLAGAFKTTTWAEINQLMENNFKDADKDLLDSIITTAKTRLEVPLDDLINVLHNCAEKKYDTIKAVKKYFDKLFGEDQEFSKMVNNFKTFSAKFLHDLPLIRSYDQEVIDQRQSFIDEAQRLNQSFFQKFGQPLFDRISHVSFDFNSIELTIKGSKSEFETNITAYLLARALTDSNCSDSSLKTAFDSYYKELTNAMAPRTKEKIADALQFARIGPQSAVDDLSNRQITYGVNSFLSNQKLKLWQLVETNVRSLLNGSEDNILCDAHELSVPQSVKFITIGRGAACDYQIQDAHVSRFHLSVVPFIDNASKQAMYSIRNHSDVTCEIAGTVLEKNTTSIVKSGVSLKVTLGNSSFILV